MNVSANWKRASTDWFHDAKWGVCCHLCFHSHPEMSADAWNQLVDRFDVDALARQLASAGASYCFQTIGQGSGHYCAPNDTYDRISGINPSKCSRRNLITDLSDALRPLGIAMMAYVPADGSWADHEARKGLGLTKHWSDGNPYTWPEYRLPAFHKNWEDICREWSVRFGTKVQGWWVDGSYHKNERYPDNEPPNLRTYAEALKAGNPDAIIAFNSGANALVVAYSQYEEFTSGEMIGNLPVGEAGFYRNFVQDKLPEADYGPIRRFIDGEQYHMLNFLGQEWGKGTPRLPTELAAGYTRYVTDHDAVITWDVPIEANGHIHEPVIRQLRAIGKATGTLIAGALLASNDPKNPRKSPTESSGLQFDGGDGDYIIYADERGGYIYLYTSHYVQVKIGAPGQAFLRHRVARCAIADKMAPGKWMKFYEGAWSEPGVGGKASYINAFTATYNTYLKKYLSFNYMSGISYCDDLSKQDWSPSFHVGKAWGIDGTWGYWATNADKNDTITSGETIFVYSFWQNQQGRRFRVDLGKGKTPPRLGFASPALYLINPVTASKTMTMDPGQHYGYTPFFESSDPIEARRARRVGCGGVETKYTGKWSDVSDPSYYEGKARASVENGASVEFTFKGKNIYWRAAKGPDSGKAEVYMDGVLQTTVDCWASAPTVYQFGFVKRNLSGGDHTIKVVVKNEKNPLSSGAAIKHMLFEHEADTWRASDCFSSVQGKNQWSQLQTGTSRFANLAFQDPVWRGADGSEIGYSHMIPGTSNVVRQWVAPHEGIVRIEGAPSIDGTSTHAVDARVLKNAGELWSARLGAPGKQASLHDTTVAVRKDDAIAFVVTKSKEPGKAAELELDTIMEKDADDTLAGLPDPPIALPQQDKQASTVRVLWDPVVTYAATLRDRH